MLKTRLIIPITKKRLLKGIERLNKKDLKSLYKKLVSEFVKLQKKVSKNIISPTEASKKILHHYIKNNKS